MRRNVVLVLTQRLDFTADLVVNELHHRGVDLVRLDTADFPLDLQLVAHAPGSSGGWQTYLELPDRSVALSEVGSIWYRRPAYFVLDPSLSSTESAFARQEARMGFGGLLRSVDCVWVNHPECLASAAHKPLQLQLAAEQGLEIPKTLITNDPDAAVDFWKECDGDVVYKTLGGPVIDRDEGRMVSIYTTRVRREDLSEMGRVRHTACMFQQYVPKKLELRLTVIGGDVHTAEIYSQKSKTGRVDWRLGYEDLTYGVHALPEQIRSRCMALTKQLGLQFAAIDMILTPDNRYVFIELNANGQWAWIEDHTGLALTAALADLLSTGRER